MKMATSIILHDENERSLRKQRIFRDRTMQLDTLDDKELFVRYRMPRHAILTLVDLVRPMLERPTQRSHPMSTETQVLATLRYLGKGGFMSEIGDLHGIAEASVSRAFHSTIDAFNSVLHNIKFPWSNQSQMKVQQAFYAVAGFPKVLGAIDGTLIPIKRPSSDQEMAFVCRKGYHALNVQAVCDANLRFTNVVSRWPGSTHDSLILNDSGIGIRMQTNVPDGWLLGDSGYACRPWLLTPLADPQTRSEERYNSTHARTRNTVERTFGVLKSRFRCLHKSTGCLWFTPEKCIAIVMAACKLHNFCVDNHVAHPPMLDDQDCNVNNQYAGPVNDGHTTRKNLINERFT